MEKDFVPNVQWMSEKYDEMNAMLFNGRLGSCGFNIFTTGRGSGGGVLGWFKITGNNIKIDRRTRRMFHSNFVVSNYYTTQYKNVEYINKDNFVDLCKPVIELNGNYRGTEHGFLSTLVHEMCHYYTYMEGWAPTQAHGREFRDIGSVVASRSNGMFTVQRIATAEQMSELELSDEMKAKREKRLANKKAAVSAVIVFKRDGAVELTITSNKSVIDVIKRYYEKKEETVVVNNNSNVIDFLFSKGYKMNMRTWRYWNIEGKPWLDELKNMLFGFENNAETDVDEPESEEEVEPSKIFTIKTSTGTFECNADSKEQLIIAIKQRFPKMSDETVEKVINNPANYKEAASGVREERNILKEILDEFLENEGLKNNGIEDSVEITPDMNLGMFSPLQ